MPYPSSRSRRHTDPGSREAREVSTAHDADESDEVGRFCCVLTQSKTRTAQLYAVAAATQLRDRLLRTTLAAELHT